MRRRTEPGRLHGLATFISGACLRSISRTSCIPLLRATRTVTRAVAKRGPRQHIQEHGERSVAKLPALFKQPSVGGRFDVEATPAASSGTSA